MDSKRPFGSFSSDSSTASTDRKREPLLPYSEIVSEKMAVKLRNPLHHCLYKRVIIWTALSLFIAGFVLFGKQDSAVRDVTPKHTVTHSGAVVITTEDSETEQFYEDDIDELAHDEAQGIIDAARSGQEQSQAEVVPSTSDEEKGSQESSGDASEQDSDGESDKAKSQLPESDKSTGKGAKIHAGGKSSKSGKPSTADIVSDVQEKDDLDEEDVPEYDQHSDESEMNLLLEGENTDQLKQELETLKKMPWLRFPQ